MEERMKTGMIGATLLTVVTAGGSYATTAQLERAQAPRDAALYGEEGGMGSGSVRLASAVTSTLLFAPEAKQSPLVTVGEGGEGGRGKKWRKHRRHYGPAYGHYRHQYRPRYYDPYYHRPRYRDPYYGRW